MKPSRRKPSYANVISTLALIVALGGGTAYAASNAGSSSPTVKLCAARKGGALRLAAGGSCRPGEQPLIVDARGARGATGKAGPAGPAGASGGQGAQGERGATGERGPAGAGGLTSPDGRFNIIATDAGIVLSGPLGSLTFDGEELRSDADLKITAPHALTLFDGTALTIISGLTTEFRTGANFTQTVGGAYEETVGAGYSQSVGAAYSQSVGGGYHQLLGAGYEQNINNGYKQIVGGGYEQSIGAAFDQSVGTTYKAQSGGAAQLAGPTVKLGAGTSCPLAARVGSEINGFLKITEVGSSKVVSVC